MEVTALLNQVFQVVKLKPSVRKFYGRPHSGVSKWAGTRYFYPCIVRAEITETPPPPKLAVVKTTSTIGLWNIFHKKLMITSIAEFSHSNQQLRHDQVDGIFPVLKITLP
jgi:hypothetical protein